MQGISLLSLRLFYAIERIHYFRIVCKVSFFLENKFLQFYHCIKYSIHYEYLYMNSRVQHQVDLHLYFCLSTRQIYTCIFACPALGRCTPVFLPVHHQVDLHLYFYLSSTRQIYTCIFTCPAPGGFTPIFLPVQHQVDLHLYFYHLTCPDVKQEDYRLMFDLVDQRDSAYLLLYCLCIICG